MKDWTTAMTVVFIAAMSIFNVLFLSSLNQSGGHLGYFSAQLKSLSGSFVSENLTHSSATAAEGGSPVDSDLAESQRETRFIIVDSDSVLSAGNPISNITPTREGLLIYKVQKGDNLSRIAANFGISLNTILWANENIKARLLSPGQEIVILPVTGVLHQIKEGDTLESIVSQYGVSKEKILRANPNLIPAKLSEVSSIIIPESRPLRSDSSALYNLPSLPGYFSIPTTGWNWGRLHNYNAVDIANACGTLIYAAAEGLVVEAQEFGWNDGYGIYLVIEHPNGTKTKYTHNQKNLVSFGDYVTKGDQIALIGNTGKTDGPTGCHLHFEVYGARNPFAK